MHKGAHKNSRKNSNRKYNRKIQPQNTTAKYNRKKTTATRPSDGCSGKCPITIIQTEVRRLPQCCILPLLYRPFSLLMYCNKLFLTVIAASGTTLCAMRYALYAVHYALYAMRYALCSVCYALCTMLCALCAACYVLRAMYRSAMCRSAMYHTLYASYMLCAMGLSRLTYSSS